MRAVRRDDGTRTVDAHRAVSTVTSAITDTAIENATVADTADTIASRAYSGAGRHGSRRVAAHRHSA